MLFRTLALLSTIAAVAGMSVVASAAEPKRVGGSKNWGAYEVPGAQTCFVHGAPAQSRGDYTRRGETYFQVAFRPGETVKDEVSVTAGYPYKPDSRVDLDIDGKKFSLFTKGDGAWADDREMDSTIVQAMKAGNRMVVRGRSTRNTLTVDTYSLVGFTAAYKAAGRACNVPTG